MRSNDVTRLSKALSLLTASLTPAQSNNKSGALLRTAAFLYIALFLPSPELAPGRREFRTFTLRNLNAQAESVKETRRHHRLQQEKTARETSIRCKVGCLDSSVQLEIMCTLQDVRWKSFAAGKNKSEQSFGNACSRCCNSRFPFPTILNSSLSCSRARDILSETLSASLEFRINAYWKPGE